MPAKTAGKLQTSTIPGSRKPSPSKTKFQADLPLCEDTMVRALKAELQLTSNAELLTDALALYRWAVSERKRGHRILSESATGERRILVFPRLERVAPDVMLPRVEIPWTEKELQRIAELVSEPAPEPTAALIRAMRQ
jgi:hypothetical protein